MTFEWTAVVPNKGKIFLERAFKSMIEGYFGYKLEMLGGIVLQVFMSKTGVSVQQMLRLAATRPQNIMPQYPGVCVHVSSNSGTLGYVCLLRSSILSDEDLESLIKGGSVSQARTKSAGGF